VTHNGQQYYEEMVMNNSFCHTESTVSSRQENSLKSIKNNQPTQRHSNNNDNAVQYRHFDSQSATRGESTKSKIGIQQATVLAASANMQLMLGRWQRHI